MKPKQYDLVVVGGGAAGLVASVAAGAFGARTALVEPEKLGGECSWTGCIPSKALINIAAGAYRCGCLPETGAMEAVRTVTGAAAKASKAGDILKRYGVDIFIGQPSFEDSHSLVMPDGMVLKSKKFILCTGSSASIPAVEGLTEGYLTNREIWDLDSLPSSLAIIGGGPIGTELAQAFHRLGTRVTLIHSGDRLLPRDDAELAAELTNILLSEGLDIRLNSTVRKVEKKDDGWIIEAGEDKISSKHLLVASGRRANTGGLNLEAAGVDYSEEKIVVNRNLRTTAANIWAAGDCIGSPRFAHFAEVEAKEAVRNALFPFNSRVNYQGNPWATFSDPELAHLGLTEEQCREQKLRYRVYSEPFAGDDRAITDRTTEGRVKIITTPLGRLLGVHILGPRAGELINELVLARRKRIRIFDLGLTIHVYPTLGMAVQRATDEWFAEWAGKPWAKFLINLARR
jgi:pyruvate/2-oxoglutarate dehydrogenase complex dihydrolipoamide dehydrogenase (E3) component